MPFWVNQCFRKGRFRVARPTIAPTLAVRGLASRQGLHPARPDTETPMNRLCDTQALIPSAAARQPEPHGPSPR